jgi:hypothetical protein
MEKHLALTRKRKVVPIKKEVVKTKTKKPAATVERPHREQFNLWGIDKDKRDRFVRSSQARGIAPAEYFGRMFDFVVEAQASDSKILKSMLKKHDLETIVI